MPVRGALPWALVALLAAPAASAQAGGDRALIEQGRALRRAGRNAAALEAFREAYALSPTPEAAGQIGFAEHALEHWEPASRFLRLALEAPADAWVVAQRRALEFSVQQVERHLGSLRVESPTAGATLSIDGRAAGALPMTEPARIAAGAVVVEVRAPGHAVDRREVTVAAGETVRLVVQLAPQVDAAPQVTALRVRPAEPAAPVGPTAPSHPPRELPAPSGVTRTLGWLSLGVAAVAIGGGVGAMVLRDDAAARWNDDARCLVGVRTREERCSDDRDAVSTAHDVMVGGYVAGGVLAVGAAVLFLVSPSTRERAAEPRVTVAVGPDRVVVGGRF